MKKALHIITNKYLVTGILFVVWVSFFDNNDWFTQKQRKREVEDAKNSIIYLRSEIAEMRSIRDGIKNDTAMLEKFSREEYHLKRDNEDVYVFE